MAVQFADSWRSLYLPCGTYLYAPKQEWGNVSMGQISSLLQACADARGKTQSRLIFQ